MPPAWRRCFAVVAALGGVAGAEAHDPGLSTAEAVVRGTEFDVTFRFDAADARLLWTAVHPGIVEPAAADPRWADLARSWCDLRTTDGLEVPRAMQVTATDDGGVRFALRYARVSGHGTLSVGGLQVLPRVHREFAIVTDADARTLAQKFLTADDPRIDFVAPSLAPSAEGGRAPGPGRRAMFRSFVRLGVEHIWTGYDHLLFLLGLVVVCRSLRSAAAIISCFTAAHSLTLAAATLNLVHAPPQAVECVIAASIAFVGVENLVRRGAEVRGRAWLTFAFGLVHGLGFATALRDLGIGSDGRGVVLPLFAFNVGVEAGQMAVAAAALPVLGYLRRGDRFARFGLPAISVFVAAAGMFWFAERAIG